jgi:predicted PurR-regulated permease PerM
VASPAPDPLGQPRLDDEPIVDAQAVRGPREIRPIQYLWIAGAVIAFAALLHWLGDILTPFLIGAIFAYFGSPAVSWGERRGIPRTLGTLLVILVVGLLLTALLLVLIPLIHNETVQVSRRLPELVGRLYAAVAPWLRDTLGIELQLDLATIKQFIADNINTAEAVGMKLLASVRTGGAILIGLLINLALIPVVMFYLLRDWNRIVAKIDELLPRRWIPRVRRIAREIDGVLAEFLRGQLSVMAVLAVYYSVALWIAGLQLALPIGILTGVLVFIPYVGFGLGLVLGVMAALLQWNGLPGFLAVLAVYGIGQLLENYVLVPWLVGDRIGLHPLAVIFALLAFGALFGFAGVLMALPASAALLVGLRHLRAEYVATELYR